MFAQTDFYWLRIDLESSSRPALLETLETSSVEAALDKLRRTFILLTNI